MVDVVPSRAEHRQAIAAFLRDRNALLVARRGAIVDSLDYPAVLANLDGELAGVATYAIDAGGCELLTLHVATRLTGLGSALLAAVQDIAREAGCRRLWVVTTNDNVDALRFYQRRGFRLVLIRPGAVDQSRGLLKAGIPRSGEYGIPLRDELELETSLVGD